MSPRTPDPTAGKGSATPIGWVIGLIAVVVFPAAASLVYFKVSKDPSLRPLGITRESEEAYAQGDDGDGRPLEITVRVHWVPDHAAGHTHISLREAFENAFAAKGIEDVSVRFMPGTDRTTITYVIGESTLGPIPVEQAAQGVNAATDAFHMNEVQRQRFLYPNR